jgi:signal peptidase II
MQNKAKYFFLALIVLIADQVSKAWATDKLLPVDTLEIIPNFFRFTYARNRGVAFSLFADSKYEIKWVLAAISLLAAIGVAYYLIRLAANNLRLNISLSLLLAGIVGNLIDRVRLGEVVDFIDFHWYEKYTWPTFNIADAAICVGAALLALEMLFEEKAPSHNATLTD